MRVWIVSNGDIVDYGFYKDKIGPSDFIICADGGTKHAVKMGILPNVILGDFDSIGKEYFNDEQLENIEFIQYSCDKDETDTQLAVEYAVKLGGTEIVLIGSLGTRMDHSFANISLLKMLLDKGITGKILNEHNEIYLTDTKIKLRGQVGEIVSVLPITEVVTGVTTKGLQYALNNAQMTFGVPNGISNVLIEEEIEISIKSGLLMVVKAKD
ncbi:thiamine diphosphokinase [Petroclostridium sp. X23]|uniref:thiamine diphosphokinase n=1 Tax=Petroclostridium sp. X23 TaxID=3045146 RepID=UPI0024AD6E6F|nr:thiamine diphosphokinase [Petroclostridium sp. X23]WHH59891.1 thiamine diphosphokinase [Petroclostridium sp. X23]